MKTREPKIKAIYEIFPNANLTHFKYDLIKNKGNVEDALYSYGLWTWEFPKYKKEIIKLKKESKLWYRWYKKNK